MALCWLGYDSRGCQDLLEITQVCRLNWNVGVVVAFGMIRWSRLAECLSGPESQQHSFGAQMSSTWFEERHEGQTLVDDVLAKPVPPHIGLFYCFGGIVFMALVAQFTSGLVLTF
jgi:hypothetical protein